MNTNNTIHPETATTLRKLLHKWIDEIDNCDMLRVYSVFKGFFGK